MAVHTTLIGPGLWTKNNTDQRMGFTGISSQRQKLLRQPDKHHSWVLPSGEKSRLHGTDTHSLSSAAPKTHTDFPTHTNSADNSQQSG